jgi:curved DNA-binding protein CbpA
VAATNYYELLEIAPAAPADEVKRAFRSQIAKYHPDKVQHLGKEFQAMAAERAAELTEAYRILCDEGRRAEYDRALNARRVNGPSAGAPPAGPSPQARRPAEQTRVSEPPPPRSGQFKQERASRDEFVRRAAIGRLKSALDAIGGGYDHAQVRGFDLALVPKSRLFSRNPNPRLLGRIVPTVDRETIADAWMQAAKWAGADEACVLLIGSALAPAGELAAEIDDQRRKQNRSGGGKMVLIPVDARDWDARMPIDAPAIAKTLVARLKSGN